MSDFTSEVLMATTEAGRPTATVTDAGSRVTQNFMYEIVRLEAP